MHRLCKFGENVPNTLQDIVLTMFRDAHTTHGRTGQKQYASGHTTLGRGIKTEWVFSDSRCISYTSDVLFIRCVDEYVI